ncbi:MAG: hypothetical protein ABJB01_09885 [Rudaea sp.]
MKNWKAACALLSLGAMATHAYAGFTQTNWEQIDGIVTSTGPYVVQTDLAAPLVEAWFGSAVATWHDAASGDDWAVVGAPAEDTFSGAAYVFRHATGDSDWHQEARLTANDATVGSRFGDSVAIDATTIVVGAPGHADDFFIGAAYVFVRDASTGDWTQQGDEFNASDREFGYAVAIHGDSLVVGDPGSNAVWTFSRSAATWSMGTKLTPSLSIVDGNFGASLAFDGTRLLIGAPTDSAVATNQGSVAVYETDGRDWLEQQILRPEIDTSAQQLFGAVLAAADESIAIGAPMQNSSTGDVHLFARDMMSHAWVEQSLLKPISTGHIQRFGDAIAIQNARLVVGASGAQTVSVYRAVSGGWSLDSKLRGDGLFGIAVATTGDSVIVGAPIVGDLAQGTAHVFIDDRIFADSFD